ncbi:putative RNA pseudouridylate synthase domain-containing protein 4-like [Triplophysa rosa]|uniref:RNA pseudouridylate synthase domain-containing protein 4-like n=1 Tax=Triplophysa rosa TaxID=992332 RepID=A0A9W7TIE3_TRIRA|nr:putative RNA pseudouridylate synthase domain-containing protein 4-like [Triplophysa rosa]
MESRALVVIVFLGVVCVAQALRCNYCQKIDKVNPTCDTVEEKECPSGLNNCIKITMYPPAYGEVRRCATDTECDAIVPQQVDKHCCSTDLCN